MLSGTAGAVRPLQTLGRSALRRRDWWVAGLFLLLTVLHTWPLVLSPFDLTTPTNDTLMNVWALRELASQLLSDPLHLLDGNAFHPYVRHSIALVDHMFANAVLVAPLWLLTGHSLFIYNMAVLATFALTGLLTYKLVVALSDSEVAGIVAGVAFAFSTIRWHQLTHLHAASTQWLPLALLALHRLLERPTGRRFAAFTGAALLVALSSWHLALFGVFSLGIVALWIITGAGRPIGRPAWMLPAAAGIVLVGLLPFAVAYVTTAETWRPDYSALERERELQMHSLSLSALVATGETARTPYAPALAQFGTGEWRGFPGLVTAALALLSLLPLRGRAGPGRGYRALLAAIGLGMVTVAAGVVLARRGNPNLAVALADVAPIVTLSLALLAAGLWAARRAGRARPGERPEDARLRVVTLAYCAVVAVGALLSLGPAVEAAGVDLGSGIYREDWLPLLSILRTPGRFTMLIALGTAVLAGLGARQIVRRVGTTAGSVTVAAVVLLVLNLDLRVAPIDLAPAPRAGRSAHSWLARTPEPGSLIEYPMSHSLWWMYLSPAHGRGLVNGAGYVQPSMYNMVKGPPDLSRAQLEILWEYFHPRFILIRGGLYANRAEKYAETMANVAAQPSAIRERVRFGRDVVYELTDRGSGPSLYRRWPRQALAEARALTFTGLVSGATEGTHTELDVLLNGRRLLHVRGAAAEQPLRRMAVYDPEWLVDGVNTFEIVGDYRLAAGTPPRPIGETGAAARADAVVVSTLDRSSIRVNGRFLEIDKGYALVVLDPETGAMRSYERFNTSWYQDDSDRLAAFIAAIPNGTPVVVASEFDVSRRLTEEAVSALGSLGLREDLRGRFNVLHAAVGVKGAPAGTALESIDSHTATVTLGSPEIRTVELSGLELQ